MRITTFTFGGVCLTAVLLLCLICLVPMVTCLADETDPAAPEDTTFLEIQLSREGIVAIDTSGYDWYYDFDSETFIQGIPERDEPVPPRELAGWSERDDSPVEERCTERLEVKPFEKKSVSVDADEYVDGDIIAWGRVTVKGWVRGDVTSLSKRVLVTETGQVDGDIEAPEIVVKEGGLVIGEILEETPLDVPELTGFSASGLIVVICLAAFFLFCGFLAVSLMPRQVRNFHACLEANKTKTCLLGLLFLLLMPVVTVLVVITIIGIVLLPFLPFLYLAAIVLGFISFGSMLGKGLALRLWGQEKSFMLRSFLGIVLLMILWLITATLLGSADEVSQGFGVFFLVLSIVVCSFPVSAGIGAAILTRFGFREYVSWKDPQRPDSRPMAPPPAPPPIPKEPPMMRPPEPRPTPPGATLPPDNRTED